MPEVAQFYLGDMVNVFRHGSLVMQNVGERTTPTQGCILYGTVSGAIGLVTQIPFDFYEFLRTLEERLTHTIKSVGKIDHSFYRSYSSEYKQEACEGFIDGDLVESFLDLNREKMAETIAGLEVLCLQTYTDKSGSETALYYIVPCFRSNRMVRRLRPQLMMS